MKVANITFHDTSNFGATLQCAALSCYLRKCGHDVLVINYLPQYVLDKKSIYKQLRKVGESGNKIKAFVKGSAYLLYSGKLKNRNKRFEDFIHKNLVLSAPYHTFEELKSNPPRADIYVCGSDQIWNPALTGKAFDKAFFLQFANNIRASYGASIGELDVKSYAEELKELTKLYSGISVREKSSADQLKEVLKRDIEVVLDCTLLLDKEDYADMETPIEINERPYLILYNIQNSAQSVYIAKKIAKERNLSIVDLSPNPFVRVEGAKKLIDIGPGEFLSYIKSSEFIVTNSFHGTVFSIIYQKQFLTIPHKTRSNRTLDLLKLLDLENRIIDNTGSVRDEIINYETVSAVLAEQRKSSIRFLDKILS